MMYIPINHSSLICISFNHNIETGTPSRDTTTVL